MNQSIYCDQAATSFPKPPEVAEAVARAILDHSASPGRSAHKMSLAASRIVFSAREGMAGLLGVDDSSRIAFTQNVTLALNTALHALLKPGDHVLTTGLEHNAVMRPLTWLESSLGLEVERIPPGDDGLIPAENFISHRKQNTSLAVINHGSNVTGAICPVEEIRAGLPGVTVLLDAAQTAGSVDLSPAGKFADVIAFTGHKGLLGPTGTGGLWVAPDLEIQPFYRGGTGSRSELEIHPDFMPDALEAGTANVHGLAGLAAGVKYILERGTDSVREHEKELAALFLKGLSRIENARVFGPADPGHRTAVVSISLENWSPSDLAYALDRDHGIMTRPGLHCAPSAHKTIGTFPYGTVRFSFGPFNTGRDIRAVLEALTELANKTD